MITKGRQVGEFMVRVKIFLEFWVSWKKHGFASWEYEGCRIWQKVQNLINMLNIERDIVIYRCKLYNAERVPVLEEIKNSSKKKKKYL